MEVNISRLDLRKTIDNWPADVPFKPALLLKQPVVQPDDWWVVDGPLSPTEPPSWAFTKSDQYVRIPLFKYQLSPIADLALAYLLQLGLSCAGHFPGPVKKCHIVTGDPVDLLDDPDTNTYTGMHYWFGLAVVIAKGV